MTVKQWVRKGGFHKTLENLALFMISVQVSAVFMGKKITDY